MEESRGSRQRRLRRCHECSRLEEDLWAMAYDQVWPIIRRAFAQPQPLPEGDHRDGGCTLSGKIAVGG
jgi:hypothetical protein